MPTRLAVLAGGDLDLVAALAQPLDDRPQDERVRRGGAVDPDPHRRAETYGPVRGGLAVGGVNDTRFREVADEKRRDCRRRRCWSRLCALVAALAGSAVALQGKNSVKSNDIAPSAVKGKDIATGAVKPADLDLIKVDGEVGPLPTASVPAIDLGGPSVTVTVPETGLVAIYARGTGQINGGGNDALAQVHLFEPTLSRARRGCSSSTASRPAAADQTPGTGNVDGTPRSTRGGWIVFPADAGHLHVLAPLQRRGRRHGTFSNTGLWAGVVG